MTTTTTRAVNRALAYAIESCEGDSDKITAIRKDFALMLRDDLPEATVVYHLSVIPIRIAQMNELERLTANPHTDSMTALAYAMAIKRQIAQKVYLPIR
jgi:hypothetical protein